MDRPRISIRFGFLNLRRLSLVSSCLSGLPLHKFFHSCQIHWLLRWRLSDIMHEIGGAMASILPSEVNGAKIDVPRIGVAVPPNPTIRCKDCAERTVNFQRSGVPSRFMFYRDGSWVDFPSQVLENVGPGFLDRRATMDVSIHGSEYRFDFLKMLQIDVLTGKRRSIAWIDVNGKCFFPKLFVNEEAVDHVSENQKTGSKMIFGDESGKRKRDVSESQEGNSSTNRAAVSKRLNSKDQEALSKRQRVEATSDSETCRWPNVKLMKKGGRPYAIAEKYFMSRLKRIDPDDPSVRVTAIHQCTWNGPLEKARWDVFHTQMERTKATRGICNTTFAWHGTSAKVLANILTYGFGMRCQVDGSVSPGFGICLYSVRSPHISAMTSEPDENGEKHVLLCRVILGNVAMVQPGTFPPNVDFDTGVDNIENPTWYVVKWANMNTHILPQCIVSYKFPHNASGQIRSPAFLKWGPYSSNTFVVKLFSKLEMLLPFEKIQELESWCKTFKAGELSKGTFLKQLRTTVGDKVLLSTINEIRGSE